MATGQFSSLLDVEIPIPVGRNFNFLLKPVEEPVNWFTSLIITYNDHSLSLITLLIHALNSDTSVKISKFDL